VQAVSTENAQASAASLTKRRASRRPRLSPDEKREVARLYADTSTSTSEICARLGIGESSLYRILQLQGVPLRGRTASLTSPGTTQAASAPYRSRNRSSKAVTRRPRVQAPIGTPAANGASVPTATRRRGTAGVARSGELLQFVVTFSAEHTIEATSALDAVQQAHARGATEVTRIVRTA
jgi:transposase-like protein